jgi:hypothetical protein
MMACSRKGRIHYEALQNRPVARPTWRGTSHDLVTLLHAHGVTKAAAPLRPALDNQIHISSAFVYFMIWDANDYVMHGTFWMYRVMHGTDRIWQADSSDPPTRDSQICTYQNASSVPFASFWPIKANVEVKMFLPLVSDSWRWFPFWCCVTRIDV